MAPREGTEPHRTAGRDRSTADGSGESRRNRAASSPSAPKVAPDGTRVSAPRRKRPSQMAPGCAGIGDAMPAGSRTASRPVPSRPAGTSRMPARVAGLGAAARTETARVAGGNGAPAIVCTNAARTPGAIGCPDSMAKPSGRNATHSASVEATRLSCSARRWPDAVAAATRAAVAEPEPSLSLRSRRSRGRSAAVSAFDGSSHHRTPTYVSVARNCAGGTVRRGRSKRRFVVSTSDAIPAMPAGPLPPSARICRVSA